MQNGFEKFDDVLDAQLFEQLLIREILDLENRALLVGKLHSDHIAHLLRLATGRLVDDLAVLRVDHGVLLHTENQREEELEQQLVIETYILRPRVSPLAALHRRLVPRVVLLGPLKVGFNVPELLNQLLVVLDEHRVNGDGRLPFVDSRVEDILVDEAEELLVDVVDGLQRYQADSFRQVELLYLLVVGENNGVYHGFLLVLCLPLAARGSLSLASFGGHIRNLASRLHEHFFLFVRTARK